MVVAAAEAAVEVPAEASWAAGQEDEPSSLAEEAAAEEAADRAVQVSVVGYHRRHR